MGSRGRSIRLRIYFLVAIPLLTMLGLFGYVAVTSITNWLNLDRAPSLIQATSEPLTNFVNVLQAERRAAVVYLSQPDAANLSSYQNAVTATKNGAQQLAVALNSSGTKSSSTPDETAAINKMTAQINGMTPLRASVTAKQLSPLDALGAYTNIIAGQGAVLQAEARSITDATPAIQGFGLISAVNTQEDMSEQDTVLASALASGSLTGPDRVAFSQAAGRQQNDTLSYEQLLTPSELATYQATLNQLAPKAVQTKLTTVQEAVPAGIPLSEMEQQGLSSATWQLLTETWLKASNKAGTTTASTVLAANQQPAIDAKRRVWVIASVGAAGLILTLIVLLLLSRSINRRLSTLRRSALTLAEEQLPAVVARLRRGESVDVAAEAPPLRVGSDEIGQVGQAIDTVRQTAIRSAIEEARIRQGVNDMFRNLARRNQSLLQRQLTVLDEMERRATDPDVLEDLFKMDHLTTRMRRHAEGLIILSGAPPGRSWSAPVKLIDVIRGAVAEVEDYARVTVSTQSRAALAGSAVTDMIHLLAELIENATTLSPPFTPVRVGGEIVANGFAIEIEDRGLGMTPQRMYELNERLANPPDINPANTEQLGLFVVGQLARRHGISVILRPSPYGGTTAVALIPLPLIVTEGPVAITSGGPGVAAAGSGNGSYGTGSYGNGNGRYGSDSYRAESYDADSYGTQSYGASASSGRTEGGYGAAADSPRAADFRAADFRAADSPRAADSRMSDSRMADFGAVGAGLADARAAGSGAAASRTVGLPATPVAGDNWSGTDNRNPADPTRSTIRVSGALRHPGSTTGSYSGYSGSDAAGTASMPGGSGSSTEAGARRGRHGTDDVPVVTGVPVNRPASAGVPPFDVFTPIRRSDAASGPSPDAAYPQSYPDFGGSAADTSYVNPYSDNSGTSGYEGSPSWATGAPGNDGIAGNNRDSGGAYESGNSAEDSAEDYKGLPRRVRQANIAPQLRASAAAASSTGVPPANAASLAVMRSTLSAMQRGWQQGRSQAQSDTEGRVDGD